METSFLKDHNPEGMEITAIILLRNKIYKTAQANGVEMSKKRAKKIAAAHLGFVDERDRDDALIQAAFKEGQRTANERYNRAT